MVVVAAEAKARPHKIDWGMHTIQEKKGLRRPPTRLPLFSPKPLPPRDPHTLQKSMDVDSDGTKRSCHDDWRAPLS